MNCVKLPDTAAASELFWVNAAGTVMENRVPVVEVASAMFLVVGAKIEKLTIVPAVEAESVIPGLLNGTGITKESREPPTLSVWSMISRGGRPPETQSTGVGMA